MKRAFICAAAALLLCAAVAQARVLVAEEEAETGRSLLQRALDCTKTHKACLTCRNQRIKGTKKTETVCSTCKAGWRLRLTGTGALKTCDCAPGFEMNGTVSTASSTCVTCSKGPYCAGGSAAAPSSSSTPCPDGLETKFTGAKSVAQCFTKLGYGRKATRNPSTGVVTYSGVICAVATYNVGGNTAGCQKCGAGLTTNGTGKGNAATDCLAPAGSYYDKGTGKKCPKGTYTDALNQAAVCTPCSDGVTTASEGSTSVTACDRALPGYKYTAANTAEKCELHTFNAAESSSPTCTACPFAMLTRDIGSKGASDCLAPPGWAQASAGADITECPVNTYKEGWNRNNCTSCGTNVVTLETGTVSKEGCLVPPGYGLTSLSPVLVAAPCVNNFYGDDEYRVAVASAKCSPCPANMYTADGKWGDAAPPNGYTNESSCLVLAGWGTTETAVDICQVGFYNAGKNRLPCQPCANGYTTLGTNSTAVSNCVIKAGWYLDAGKDLPAPCDKGSYSAGGTASVPAPTSCTPCSAGYTTQEQESEDAADCAVCAAGYGSTAGGSTCEVCASNTFSSGGLAVGEACVDCAAGSTSGPGATENTQCYVELADPTKDYFSISNDALYVASGTAAACQAACTGDATCVALKISTDTDSCFVLSADAAGTATVSFKVNSGVDYVRYKIPAGLEVGAEVGTDAATTVAGCEAACKSLPNCEAIVLDGTCKLIASELSADFTGFYHVSGANLASSAP